MAGAAWPNSSSRRLSATHRSAGRHSRVQVVLNGIAWERIALSFSHVVEISWPSLLDLPEEHACLGFPGGRALAAGWSGGALLPRASRGRLVMPSPWRSCRGASPAIEGARQDSLDRFPAYGLLRPPPARQKNVPCT